MNKSVAVLGLLFLAVATAGCSGEPETEATPTTTATPETSPTEEPDITNGLEFGATVTMEAAGSTWAVRVDEPRDVTEDVAKQYENTGLELALEEGMTYVGVPGTITRIGDGPADPSAEVDVAVIIDNRVMGPDTQYLDDAPPLSDVGELFPDGTAEFMQIFQVEEGADISTVAVYAGVGEESQQAFFGEAVDLGKAEESASSSPDVETMKYLWDQASSEQRAESATSWDLDGGKVTEAGVDALMRESAEVGVILDEGEAREFLDWALTQ